MTKMKLMFAVIGSILIVSVLVGVFSPSAFASAKDAVCQGAGLIGDSANCEVPADQPNVDSTVKKGMQLFSAVVGVIALVMFIIGGLKYMTSQGDPGQTNSAKNTLIYAAVGLVVVALAQLFIRFVLERFTK